MHFSFLWKEGSLFTFRDLSSFPARARNRVLLPHPGGPNRRVNLQTWQHTESKTNLKIGQRVLATLAIELILPLAHIKHPKISRLGWQRHVRKVFFLRQNNLPTYIFSCLWSLFHQLKCLRDLTYLQGFMIPLTSSRMLIGAPSSFKPSNLTSPCFLCSS